MRTVTLVKKRNAFVNLHQDLNAGYVQFAQLSPNNYGNSDDHSSQTSLLFNQMCVTME